MAQNAAATSPVESEAFFPSSLPAKYIEITDITPGTKDDILRE